MSGHCGQPTKLKVGLRWRSLGRGLPLLIMTGSSTSKGRLPILNDVTSPHQVRCEGFKNDADHATVLYGTWQIAMHDTC